MSIDLIDIALEKLTDFARFEALASEVMNLEGYINIKPLGGVSDEGQDAVEERYYKSGALERIVFQYTLQRYLPGKVAETIATLSKFQVPFTELVIVTPNAISAERQADMKREARVDHGISLDIYERATLRNRLADTQNGIFNRYFASIRAQIEDLVASATRAKIEGTGVERAMLQVSLALSFKPETERARQDIADSLLIAIILAEPAPGVVKTELADRWASIVGGSKPEQSLIEAALRRLHSDGMIRQDGDRVTPSNAGTAAVAASTIRIGEATESLVADVINQVAKTLPRRSLRQDDIRRIGRNVREALVQVARTNGVFFASQLVSTDRKGLRFSLTTSDDAVNAAKRQLSNEIGELVVAALGQILKTPTNEQASTVQHWIFAYLACAIMGFDPLLQQVQLMRLKGKVFALDTDTLLDTLVSEQPRSASLRSLWKALIGFGCRVVIPASCLQECILHAQLSPKTQHYFGDTLLTLPEAAVNEMVGNVFVKGFYYGRTSGNVSETTGFDAYLRNYYDEHDPEDFLREVVLTTLPEGMEVVELGSLLKQEVPPDDVERFAEAMSNALSLSRKARYRTEEQTKTLALNDATLFLTALHVNQTSASTRQVLGGACYLVTESSRYTRAAAAVGIEDVVTTRPQSLLGLQHLVGATDISAADFLTLFENPFVEYAIERARPEIEGLIRSGVVLHGVSLPRLRRDVDEALHARLTALQKAENAAETEQTTAILEGESDRLYLEFLGEARRRGYALIPAAERLRETVERAEAGALRKDAALHEAIERQQDLESQIEHFGRRRQRYLRRMARQRGEKS